MTIFADSSALVKLYVEEDGSDEVTGLTGVVVSQLVRVEVPAAIWRKCRAGLVTAAQTSLLVATFEADYQPVGSGEPRFVAVGLTQGVVDAAARLCAVHRLRGYDAVHLATACAARGVMPECTTFAAYDKELRAAAAAERFALFPRPAGEAS